MMKIIFLGIIFAHVNFASTLNYLQETANISHEEAKILDHKISKQSKNLSFLNCPIKLIERQIRGPESVKKGIEYLLAFLYQSSQADPDYQSVEDNCLDTLEEYSLHHRNSSVRGRYITSREIEALRTHFASENQALIDLIINNLNRETLCYTNRVEATASFFVGISLGASEMQCYTPLGRRFTLRGPSLGVGTGLAGASITLPNLKYLNNPLKYRFFLYKRSNKDTWYTAHISQHIACGPGAVIEQSRNHVFARDLRPAIGFNFSYVKSYQFMTKNTQRPYYSKIIQTELFDDMANSAFNIK